MPDITPVVVILDGQPVSSINPLPTSGGGGGGGGGIVEQGKQGSIASPWFVQPTADGATVSLPLPTGAATDAKQDTGNSSLATIATTQADGTQKTQVTSSALPTGAATAAKQPALGTAGTPSADVLSVQGVVGGIAQPISAASLPLPAGAATSALQGGGLPAALVGGRLDVNIGASTSLTDAQLRATPVPVSATITPSGTQDVNLTKVGGSAITLGQKTGANSLPVVLASDTGTLTVATNATAGSTVGETVVNCSTAQILLAATAAPKVRKIYNRAGNGRLFIRYGSAPTSETNCNFAVEPGSSWEMQILAPGVLEYVGDVYGIIPSGASTAHGLQVT